MNSAILIGRLTSDPELKKIPSGAVYCRFNLAVQREFANRDGNRDADFLPIIAWNKQAEACARYLSKGKQVCVMGAIRTRSYESQDGSRRHVTEISAWEVEFLGSRADRQESRAEESNPVSGFEEGEPDDMLPF